MTRAVALLALLLTPPAGAGAAETTQKRGQPNVVLFTVLTERRKLVQPCGMDLPNQQHIRNRYAQLCRLQGRGERSIEGPPRYELYDIAADPGETKDLAAEHPEIVEAMKRQYDAWFTDVAARWQDREGKKSP